MEFKFPGEKTVHTVDKLAAARAANNFPDVLFFAGGEVFQPGVKAKFRLSLKWDGGGTIMSWQQTVEHLALDGTPFGHMFDAKLVASDDLPNRQINISAEVNTGSGYEPLGLANIESIAPANPLPGVPGVYGYYFQLTNAAGSAGCVIGMTFVA